MSREQSEPRMITQQGTV